MNLLKTKNEWELARLHKEALSSQDFETCQAIQNEVNSRIENNTLQHKFMQSFRYYNPETQQFEGNYKLEGLNGLFDKYIEKYLPTKYMQTLFFRD